MRAVILGSAAGGGFPQWNSGSEACRRARASDPFVKSRTQASVAVSSGGDHWFLINASPDLRQQIESISCLQPQARGRSSPIVGVVLTSGEVDAIAGLLTLRERQAFSVFATDAVTGILAANPIFDVLARDVVRRVPVRLDEPFVLPLTDGSQSGLTCTLFAVPGKVPLYMEGGAAPDAAVDVTMDGTTVGAVISDASSTLVFIPGCAMMTQDLADRLRGADVVLFDGTLWQDDEMLRAGAGAKTGRRMGHMSVSGEHGVMAALEDLAIKRRVFIHINNTNPILLEDSAEYAAVRAGGWEVAFDGMEVSA